MVLLCERVDSLFRADSCLAKREGLENPFIYLCMCSGPNKMLYCIRSICLDRFGTLMDESNI